MNDQPFISVIIPTYNREETLFRALDSVLSQTYKNFEIIVIDDGSTDSTERKFSEWKKELSHNIIYIKNENQGVSSARNFGVSKACGEWLAFLDSDDEWLLEKLQKQIEFIHQYPDFKLVHGEEIWIRNGKRVNPKNIHQKSGGDIFERSLKLCLISPSAVLLKKDLFLEMGGFDTTFIVCEDYDLWLKITSLYEVGYIREPIIKKYGGHEDQLSRKYFAMDYYRVKSMDRILSLRTFSQERMDIIKKEIVFKCEVLIKGYEKHQNFENYKEVKSILGKFFSKSFD